MDPIRGRVSRKKLGLPVPRRPSRKVPDVRLGVVVHSNGTPLGLNPAWPEQRLLERERVLIGGIVRWHRNAQRDAHGRLIKSAWPDGAYSDIIGQSGTLYTIRGKWDQFANGGRNPIDRRTDTSDLPWWTVMVMVGDDEEPTEAALSTLIDYVGWRRSQGHGNRVLPHSDFRLKRCPGDTLRALCRRIDRRPVVEGLASPATVSLRLWGVLYLGEWRTDPARYSAIVELWQRGLRRAGQNPGRLDGRVGAKTEEANRRFMEAQGLTPDGRPSQVAWNRLLKGLTTEHRR